MIKLDCDWDALNFTPVESSIILACAYDKNTCSMVIKFNDVDELGNTSQYLYCGVPPSVYEKFLKAESKGAHLNVQLKAYPYIKLK